MTTTIIILEVDHDKPIPDLLKLVEGRAYTLQGVKDTRAWGLGSSTEGVARKFLVDVYYAGEGEEFFICATYGTITTGILGEIEKDLEEVLFENGMGTYRFEVTRFPGQYGEYDMCEIAPGWELDEIAFIPNEACNEPG